MDALSEETTSEKEPSVVVPLHRKRKKLAKVAGIGIVCGISVFAASMTSEANRNYFINTFQVLTGNNMRTVVDNTDENEKMNVDEYEAIADIEEKLGVEVPEFCYRPYEFEFIDYLINDICSTAWMEYQYENVTGSKECPDRGALAGRWRRGDCGIFHAGCGRLCRRGCRSRAEKTSTHFRECL